ESSLIKSWINNKDDNTSAIETLEKPDMHHTPYFDINIKPQDNPLYQEDGQFRLSLYGKAIATELNQYTESVAKHILGQPNMSKSDKDYLVFGSGDSHIKISLTGEYRGFYRDWTTGDRGSLINLIADTQNISFKQAVSQAQRFLSEPEKFNLVKNENHEKLLNTLTKQMSQFKERATEYFENGKDIEGTPAQAYLERFNTSDTPISNHSELRYHDNVYSSDSKTTHPALISKLSNNQQGLEAAEITYLTQDGELANLKTPKRLMGNKSTHSVNIHEGSANISVISVGVEQALSFNNDNKHDVDIIAVNNVHDLRTVDMSALRDEIIIMMGSNKPNEKLTTEIVDRMAERGYSVSIINDTINNLTHNDQQPEQTANDIANDKITELTHHEQIKHTELEQLAKEILSNNEHPLPDNDSPQLNAKQSDAISDKENSAMEAFERASIPDKQISKDERSMEYDELTK
ncbi:hypothetical protein L2748_21535, partial [Shewanella sairae]|uniref:DUF7146 domain-containing protein n=1 Tax=Shewanella sairae TaxID=190310 RepID=UPI003B838D79|nr:hypothetical protein [Shewanella sairae]